MVCPVLASVAFRPLQEHDPPEPGCLGLEVTPRSPVDLPVFLVGERGHWKEPRWQGRQGPRVWHWLLPVHLDRVVTGRSLGLWAIGLSPECPGPGRSQGLASSLWLL